MAQHCASDFIRYFKGLTGIKFGNIRVITWITVLNAIGIATIGQP